MAEKIAVITDKIKIKREEWLRDLGKVEECFVEAGDLLNKLDAYFMGKPVEIIKEKTFKVQEEGTVVLAGVKVHIEKLGEIAAIYDQAERSNSNVTTDN